MRPHVFICLLQFVFCIIMFPLKGFKFWVLHLQIIDSCTLIPKNPWNVDRHKVHVLLRKPPMFWQNINPRSHQTQNSHYVLYLVCVGCHYFVYVIILGRNKWQWHVQQCISIKNARLTGVFVWIKRPGESAVDGVDGHVNIE